MELLAYQSYVMQPLSSSPQMHKAGSVRINNIEALSRNRCCSGKAINDKYYECVCVCSLSYPTCLAHAPYYVVICGLSVKCYLNPASGIRVVACRRTDVTKLIVAFRSFANAPNKNQLSYDAAS